MAGMAVITGGYGGTMEAASRGAAEAGGHVIGVVAPSLFPTRPWSNDFVTEVIEATSLPERIGTLIDLADAAIALPGSIGTAAELLLIWNHNQIARAAGKSLKPTAVVGAEWAGICDILADTTSVTADGIYPSRDVETGVSWVLGRLNSH